MRFWASEPFPEVVSHLVDGAHERAQFIICSFIDRLLAVVVVADAPPLGEMDEWMSHRRNSPRIQRHTRKLIRVQATETVLLACANVRL
jgi:hypothetical protein